MGRNDLHSLERLKKDSLEKTDERIKSILEDVAFYESKITELREQLFALRKWRTKLNET